MSWRIHVYLAVFISMLRGTNEAVSVSITSEPEGDPAGVYQAATPVTLTCTHNGSSSATYSWTCLGENNCFTQGVTQPVKKRGILRGGDTGTHTCTISDGGMTGTASTDITVTGIGFSYAGVGGSFHYVANNSAIFIGYSSSPAGHVLTRLECASGTSTSDPNQLLFIPPPQYKDFSIVDVSPGHWRFLSLPNSAATIPYYIPSFSGGVFMCRMPDENGAVVDTSVGIYPDNYDKNSLSVSVSSNQSGLALSLTCTSTGLPPTAVTWSKNGVEMSSGDKYAITQRVTDVANTIYENTVVMSGDSECDLQGLYQCTVQCYDDNGLLVNSASVSTSVTVSINCLIPSTQSIRSTSSSTFPITTMIISTIPITTTITCMFPTTTTSMHTSTIPITMTSTSTIPITTTITSIIPITTTSTSIIPITTTSTATYPSTTTSTSTIPITTTSTSTYPITTTSTSTIPITTTITSIILITTTSTSIYPITTTNTSTIPITTTNTSTIPITMTSTSTFPITTTSSNSTSSTTVSTQITAINTIVTWTIAVQVPTVTEQPSEGPPLADEFLYAIIAGEAALLILLLLFIIICCCCCAKRRRNGNQECADMKDIQIQESVAYSSHNIKKSIPNESGAKGILIHGNLSDSSHSVGQTVSECPVQEREYEAVDAVSCKQEEARQIQDHIYECIKN